MEADRTANWAICFVCLIIQLQFDFHATKTVTKSNLKGTLVVFLLGWFHVVPWSSLDFPFNENSANKRRAERQKEREEKSRKDEDRQKADDKPDEEPDEETKNQAATPGLDGPRCDMDHFLLEINSHPEAS